VSSTWPPGSPAWLFSPIASTIRKPCSALTAPAQASAVYQPIELPVTAATSKRVAVDGEEIGVGGGEDERRGDVAARVQGRAEAVGAVSSERVGWPRSARSAVEGRDQLRLVAVMALQIAELALP
jgi:hypothetical protein